MITHAQSTSSSYKLPLNGASSPAATPNVTTPGSFANAPDIGGPLMFSSPDTPGMPPPSDKTAWDFLPEDWRAEILPRETNGLQSAGFSQRQAFVVFTDTRGITRRITYPADFKPITQLEHARLGIITPQMQRVAQREPHF